MLLFQLPEILSEIGKLIFESEMPCFHPESVIFLTNKWDLVEAQADDEAEVTKVWETLKTGLQRRWPSVREEHIFRLNLKQVIYIYIYRTHVYFIFKCIHFYMQN